MCVAIIFRMKWKWRLPFSTKAYFKWNEKGNAKDDFGRWATLTLRHHCRLVSRFAMKSQYRMCQGQLTSETIRTSPDLLPQERTIGERKPRDMNEPNERKKRKSKT